jgi:hypothetical protein
MRTVGAGQSYYPEMGERHDGTALFERSVGCGGYYLKWNADRHDEALAKFKELRIRPRSISQNVSIKNERTYWSCIVTWDAGRKLREVSVTECLL